MYDTYKGNYLKHSTFRFNLIDHQLNTDFPSQFCIFDLKITKRHSKIDFLRKCFYKELKLVAFSSQNYRLRYFFYSNWKQLQVFKIA